MIYEDMTQEDVDSILDGDFSCETTEDLYEPSDDELLYPSRHFDWFHDKVPESPKVEYMYSGDGGIYYDF